MSVLTAFLSLAIERPLGYPDRLFRAIGHPVTWIGALISCLDRTLNRAADVASRKIIRNGTVEFEVRSFDDTYQTVSSVVGEEGGFVASTSSEKLANGKVRGTIVVRVAPDRLDRFLLKLRALGELKSQQIGSADVTKQYTDIESELRGLRTMETRLIDLIKTGKGEVKDLVEAEKQLGEYRVRIEKLEGEIRYYNNLVAQRPPLGKFLKGWLARVDSFPDTVSAPKGGA